MSTIKRLSVASFMVTLAVVLIFGQTSFVTVTLSAALSFFHLDLGMEPSLEDKLWLTNPSGF